MLYNPLIMTEHIKDTPAIQSRREFLTQMATFLGLSAFAAILASCNDNDTPVTPTIPPAPPSTTQREPTLQPTLQLSSAPIATDWETATRAPTFAPTATRVPQSTATIGASSPTPELLQQRERLPSEIIDLTNWKQTLPIGREKHPTEIKQPELKKFLLKPWFFTDGDAVVFRAAVNGVTTGGSSYPRSELREMTNEGRDMAAWSSISGRHTMEIEQAITHLPKKKQHIVAGQIHGAKDDVFAIRLEGKKLHIDQDGDNVFELDKNYELGRKFNIKFVIEDGIIQVYYNGKLVYRSDEMKFSGAYFKAGAYPQSNDSKEDLQDRNQDNYGEVKIFKLYVTHE